VLSVASVAPVDELKHSLTPYPEAANLPVRTALDLEMPQRSTISDVALRGYTSFQLRLLQVTCGVAVLHAAALFLEQPVTVTNSAS